MKHINESIIGRKGNYNSSKTPGALYPGQDLEYGDVVVPDGMNVYYICLPYPQWKSWWPWWKSGSDYQTLLVRYRPSIVHSASYSYDFAHDYKFVRHVGEYKTIHTIYDLKRIFDKYNIPYE